MKDKFEIWVSFDNWRISNANRLSKEYDELKSKGEVDNISYLDYVGGRWQTNNL